MKANPRGAHDAARGVRNYQGNRGYPTGVERA